MQKLAGENSVGCIQTVKKCTKFWVAILVANTTNRVAGTGNRLLLHEHVRYKIRQLIHLFNFLAFEEGGVEHVSRGGNVEDGFFNLFGGDNDNLNLI